MPGIVAGTLLTFIPAAGDYVNSALLGTAGTSMIGNVIDARFFRVVDYPTAAALSVILMAAILLLVSCVRPPRRDGGAGVSRPAGPSGRRLPAPPAYARDARVRLPAHPDRLHGRLLFNDAGRSNLVWRGFTLDNWANPCGAPRSASRCSTACRSG